MPRVQTAVLPALTSWWVRWRASLVDALLVVAAVLAVAGVLDLAVRSAGWGILSTRVGGVDGVIPWWVMLVLGVPASAWAASHALSLARFGGAVLVAFDAAILAFLLWVGLGSRLAELCRGQQTCSPEEGTTALLGVGAWTVLAWLVGVLVSELRQPENRVAIRLFNTSLAAVGGAAFLAVTLAFRWDVPEGALRALARGSIGPRDLLSIVAAAVVYTLVDLVITALSVAWSERVRVREVLHDVNALVAAATAVGVLCSAVFAALMTLHNPWSLILLVPVVWALLHAARVGTLASSEQERSTALYRAAEACQQAEAAEDILDAVAAAAGQSLHAKIVLDEPPRTGGLGVEVRRGAGTVWLTARQRSSGRRFNPRDSDTLATLAAIAGQALARVDSTDQIRRVAEQDALTGLATRRVLLQAAGTVIQRAADEDGDGAATGPREVSLIFCDVDEFKAINDTLGHGVGDAVLVEVASRLRAQVRPRDVVARLGGDEFAVLLPGADQEAAREVRERLLDALAAPHQVGDQSVRVGLSVGCATWDPAATLGSAAGATDWLLDEADRDMYDHKRGSRSGRLRSVGAGSSNEAPPETLEA